MNYSILFNNYINLFLITFFFFIFFTKNEILFFVFKSSKETENKKEEKNQSKDKSDNSKNLEEERKKKYQDYLNRILNSKKKTEHLDLRSFYLKISYFDRYLKQNTLNNGSFYKIFHYYSIYPTLRQHYYKTKLQYFTNFDAYISTYYKDFELKKLTNLGSNIYLIDHLFNKIKQFFVFNSRLAELHENYGFLVIKLKKWNQLFLGNDPSHGLLYKFVYKYYLFNSKYMEFKKIYQRYNSLNNFKLEMRETLAKLLNDLSRSYKVYILNFILAIQEMPNVSLSKIPISSSFLNKSDIDLQHKLVEETLDLNPVPIYRKLITKVRNFMLPDFSNKNTYLHSIRKYLINNNQINYESSIRFINIYLFLSNYIPSISNLQVLKKLHSFISFQDYLFGLTTTTYPLLSDFKFFTFFEKNNNQFYNLLDYIPSANNKQRILEFAFSNKLNSLLLSESQLLRFQLHRNYFFRQMFSSFIISLRHSEYQQLNKQIYSMKYQKFFDFLYKNISADSFNLNKEGVTGYYPDQITKYKKNYSFNLNYRRDGFLRKLYRISSRFASLIGSQIRDKYYRFIYKPKISYSRIYNKLNQSRLKLRHNLISFISEFIKLNNFSLQANYYLIYLLNFNFTSNQLFSFFFFNVKQIKKSSEINIESIFFNFISNITFNLFFYFEQQKNLSLVAIKSSIQYLSQTKLVQFIIEQIASFSYIFLNYYKTIIIMTLKKLYQISSPFLIMYVSLLDNIFNKIYYFLKLDFYLDWVFYLIKIIISFLIKIISFITSNSFEIVQNCYSLFLNIIHFNYYSFFSQLFKFFKFYFLYLFQIDYKTVLYNLLDSFFYILLKRILPPIIEYSTILFNFIANYIITQVRVYVLFYFIWNLLFSLIFYREIPFNRQYHINKIINKINDYEQFVLFYFSRIYCYGYYFFRSIENTLLHLIKLSIVNLIFISKKLKLYLIPKTYILLSKQIKKIKGIGYLLKYFNFTISLFCLVYFLKFMFLYQLLLYISNNFEYNYLIYFFIFIFYSFQFFLSKEIDLFFFYRKNIYFRLTNQSKYKSHISNHPVKEMINFFVLYIHGFLSQNFYPRLLKVTNYYKTVSKNKTHTRYFGFYDRALGKSKYFKNWVNSLALLKEEEIRSFDKNRKYKTFNPDFSDKFSRK